MATASPDPRHGPCCRYEFTRVSEDGQRRCEVTDPFVVLHYRTDPHARVAVEAYADSCAREQPKVAEGLYRALGFDIEVQPVCVDAELLAYLARCWQGRWVAVRGHRLIAAGDTIHAARAAVTDGARFSVLYMPAAAAAGAGADELTPGPSMSDRPPHQSQPAEMSESGANHAT